MAVDITQQVTNVIQNSNFNPQDRRNLSILLSRVNTLLLAAGTTQADLTALSDALVAGVAVCASPVSNTPIPSSNNNPTT